MWIAFRHHAESSSGRLWQKTHICTLVTSVKIQQWLISCPFKSFLCQQVKERAAPTAVKQVDEIMKAVRQGTTTTDVLLSRNFPDELHARVAFRIG